MKYLIISIYDSGWGFSVCENGKVIKMDDKEINFYHDIFTYNNNYSDKFAELDFDLIILCENGNTEILKNYDKSENKTIIFCGRTPGKTQELIDMFCKNYKEVKITTLEDEKKIKALEIIKEKNVDTALIKISIDFNTYNYFIALNKSITFKGEKITQEEFNILKEVL